MTRIPRNGFKVRHLGKTLLVADLAALYKIPYITLHSRLKLGWPVEKALTLPKGAHFKRGHTVNRSALRRRHPKPKPASEEEAAKLRVQGNAANKKFMRRLKRGLT